MQTPGLILVHSVSAVQPRHVPAVVLQIGVLPEHWLLLVHWTHWPAKAPVFEHIVLPSVRLVQPVAPGVAQPVQEFDTQKAFAGSFVHWRSPKHSTHWPADVPVIAQVVLPSVLPAQPVAPVVEQPVHRPFTQKAFAGSFMHWPSTPHSTH
jgi:hypothetical protein